MAPDHELTIPAGDLDAGGRAYDLPLRQAWLRGILEGTNVEPGPGDGSLRVRASKSGTDVILHGTLAATLVVPCARCLEPAKVAVAEEVSALFVPSSALREADGTGGEGDAPADQADMLPYDGENVVLDDLIRDELVLAVPMIPLCSEACPGISPPRLDQGQQPAEPGIDPRLRPLLRLKKTMD